MLRLCLAATLLCLASALPTIENADHPGRVPGEYLVVLKPAPAEKAKYVQEVLAKIQSISPDITILRQMDALQSPILHVKADDLTMNQALQIAEVASIGANVFEKRIQQCAGQAASLYWGLDRIDSRFGVDDTYNYRTGGGAGVNVYVLDTGIRYSHQEFLGRASLGISYYPEEPEDGNGHGTHVAGTIGGTTTGVAKSVYLVDVKVLNNAGGGNAADIVAGINWVVDNVGSSPGVINLSFSSPGDSAIDSAVNSAVASGVPVVVAAGNNDDDACNYSPGRAPGAITVASCDNSDIRSEFSNTGFCCDLFAPGTEIRSAGHTSDTAYSAISGTSMSCAHVAGGIAVFLQQNPTATPAQVRTYLTSQGTPDVITDPGIGTPNVLLYEDCGV